MPTGTMLVRRKDDKSAGKPILNEILLWIGVGAFGLFTLVFMGIIKLSTVLPFLF